MVFVPLMVIVKGPPAACGANFTNHVPSGPALIAASLPSKVTVTDSPASAVPHTAIG